MLLNIPGDTFKRYADKLMRSALHKGVPPLFVNLRSLYKDPEKVSYIFKKNGSIG